MDPSLAEQQREILLTRIVPGVRLAPGLVKGYWAGDAGSRSHTFIVFADRETAEAFAASVRNNIQAQGESGVSAVELAVVPVAAET